MRATPAPASRAAALTLSGALTAILLLAMLSLGIERRAARRGATMTVELLPLPPAAPPPPAAPRRQQPDTPRIPTPVPVAPAPIVKVARAATVTTAAAPAPPITAPSPATARTGAAVSDATGAGPGSAEREAVATTPPDAAAFSRSNPPPVYPDIARRRRQQGVVVISVSVSAQGLVTALRLRDSSGFPALDEAALAAVRRWRFAPATRGGAAIAAQGYVELPFVLRRR